MKFILPCLADAFFEYQGGCPLKEKIQLTLVVERNLEGDISHSAPDFRVKGVLSSVHCSLDTAQYKLVRGILDHNLGEKLPEFQQPLMSHLMDPVIDVRPCEILLF